MIRDLHVLALCGASWWLLWWFYAIWEKNRPRSYSPDHPPEELLS
jgi:hypothetical protein